MRKALVVLFFLTSLFPLSAVAEKKPEKNKKINLSGVMYELGPTAKSVFEKRNMLMWRGLNLNLANKNLMFSLWFENSEKVIKKKKGLQRQFFGLGSDISPIVYQLKPKKRSWYAPTVKIMPGIGAYVRAKYENITQTIPGKVGEGPTEIEVTESGKDKKLNFPKFKLTALPYLQLMTVASFDGLNYKQLAPRFHIKIRTSPAKWRKTKFMFGIGVNVLDL